MIDSDFSDEEVTDIVDDSCTESEIVEFLDKKYGALKWMAYNIEPE